MIMIAIGAPARHSGACFAFPAVSLLVHIITIIMMDPFRHLKNYLHITIALHALNNVQICPYISHPPSLPPPSLMNGTLLVPDKPKHKLISSIDRLYHRQCSLLLPEM